MAETVTTVSAPVERLSSPGVPEREQAPAVDDREAVAELVGLLHVVRGEEDGLALAVQLAEDLPQREAALRVEAGGRLVEEEDRGPVHDRPRHHQALRHAARERGDRLLRPARTSRNCSSRRSASRLRRRGRHPEEAAVEVEVLPHGERAVERVALRHHADHLLRRGRVRDHVDAADEGAPAGGDHARREHAGGRGLARAVGPEQAEDLALVHLEVELVDRLEPTRVHLGELLGADDHVVSDWASDTSSRCSVLARARAGRSTCGCAEARGSRTSTSRLVRIPRSSSSSSCTTSWSSCQSLEPGGGDDDAHDAPVVGIGRRSTRPSSRQLVEVADERGRLDAHVLRRARAGWRRRRWPLPCSSTQFQRLAPCSCSRRSSSSCTAGGRGRAAVRSWFP